MAFRLWITTDNPKGIPANFLLNSTKLLLEPLQELRTSSAKIFNSTASELITGCPELQHEYKLIYFAMTFFHSMMTLRDKFGRLGWNMPYKFCRTDH